MTTTATSNQPLVSTTSSRQTKRRNPASRAKDNQTTPSGPLQTRDLPKPQQQHGKQVKKPVSRVDYKPEPDFNVHEIVPSSKSSKSLSRLAQVASSNSTRTLPLARIDDCPSPGPSDIASSADKVQESIPKLPIGDPDSVLFVAYGVEAHITQALKNEICWKFVSERHYCPYRMLCVRIHPKDKAKYAEQGMEELRRYGEEKDKARAALEELMKTANPNPNPNPAESIDQGLNKPAKVDRSDLMVSSTSSSPSTPSLSLSSITTLSSQTSFADSSAASSDFYSAGSSPIRLSPSASKANSSISSGSSPRLVESPLDTPTLNRMQISPQETPPSKPTLNIQGSGSAKAPRFYGATISEYGSASESCSQSSAGLSGNVCLSTTRRSSYTSTLPPHAKSTNASTSSMPPTSQHYPMLLDRVNIPPRHSSYNRGGIPHNAPNHTASTLQHQAVQKLSNVSTEPIHDQAHPRQHFRDSSLPMSRNMPHDNYEYRYRSPSRSIIHPPPPKPPIPPRHQQNYLSHPLHTTMEGAALSLSRPNNQRHDISSPRSLNNTTRESPVTGWKGNVQRTSAGSRVFDTIQTLPAYTQRVDHLQVRRPFDPSSSNTSFAQQPFTHKPVHTIVAGFKHAVHAHLIPDYDKSLQRVQVETASHYITDTKIRATFGPGFSIVDVVTGMDTCWLYFRGFPPRWSPDRILRVLGECGEVSSIQNLQSGRTGPPLKAQFKTESGALRAMRQLHGRVFEGRKLEISLGLKTGKDEVAVIRDTTVQVDVLVPYVNIWVGYETEEASLAAIEKARTTPFKDFWTTAEPFQGIPAVGFKTVKFVAPGFMKPDDMKLFGENEGVVTPLSYRDSPYPTMETVESGLRKLLQKVDNDHLSFKAVPGPYRNGFVRFNITCSDGDAALKLAQQLDHRWIIDVARVYSRRVFSMTLSVERSKYQKSAAQIMDLSWTAKKLGPGHSILPEDRGSTSVQLHITAENIKSLGFLKSQIDKIWHGTVVTGPDGRRLWDNSFEFGQGVTLVRDLERRFAPVVVRRDLNRRTIRVFGPEGKADNVRRIIENRILDVAKRAQRSIPLDGALWTYFCDGPFQDLEDQLGSEAIQLEYQTLLLHVRGDDSVYLTAAQAVKEARRKMRALRNGVDNQSDCPVCFSKVDHPVKLLCGHEYCQECLQQYLNTAVVMKFFPLTCHGNGGKCNERIALEIARKILTPSQWDDVVRAAFKAHIQQNPDEFHYCPTPDCNEVYRPAPEGIIYHCPSCFSQICPNCNSEAHKELTCAEVKEGVGEYRIWAEQNNVKQCPKCKVGIEKAAGCNHMTCTMCKTHICWVCLQTFPDGGSGIYDHMRDKHGGMGLVPDVEEDR